MKEKLFNKKNPALFGLLIILIGIFITIYLVNNGSLFLINAGPGQDPKNAGITNISDTSFTLTYTTDDKTAGTLNYGIDPGNLDTVVLDDRDQLSQSINEYNVHSITVKNLNPEFVYYFNIISGDKTYLKNGSPYNIKTGPVIENDPSDKEPLSGKVILPDGSNASEALIYFSLNGAQKLSSVIKNDGNYTIPLNTLRNKSLNDYIDIDKNSIINIEVRSGNLFSSVSVSPDEINPVPVITLSNNYDFSSEPEVTSELNNKSQEVGFPSLGADSKSKTSNLSGAGGTQISASPTPSATLTPTPNPTPTAEPTQIPTLSATLIPTIPPTGNSSAIIAVFAAVAAIGGGIVLFLLTRGQISL